MKVVWDEYAELDLDEICSFLSNVNPEASDRLYFLIIKDVNELAKASCKGRIEESTRNTECELRSFVSSNRNYRIVYYVDETNNTVYITHILDCRRDPYKFKPERFTLPYYSAENN